MRVQQGFLAKIGEIYHFYQNVLLNATVVAFTYVIFLNCMAL